MLFFHRKIKYTPLMRLVVEAFVVGISVTFLFYLISSSITSITGRDHWRSVDTDEVHLLMEIAITGALFHVLCEYTDINRWYCTQYQQYL